MDYCLADGDGAVMWTADPAVDVDGDGVLDGVGLDLDGDGRLDDVLADLDRDGLAEHGVRDFGGAAPIDLTDDGTGMWGMGDGRALRWYSLEGVEATGGPMLDFDGDGRPGERLLDVDGNGLADRVLGAGTAYVDTDGDGRWDLKLTDADGDGAADAASPVGS